MSPYLQCIKKYCHNLEQSGKIVPIEFNFPSFKIERKNFLVAVLNYVKERVEIGLESGEYGNKKFSDTLTYSNLLASENSDKTTISKGHIPNLMYLDKVLPSILPRDSNLMYHEINRNALRDICVNNMQNQLLGLKDLMHFSVAYGSDRSEYEQKKTEFVGTLLMLKEQIPYAYQAVKSAMKSTGKDFDAIINVLTILEKEPGLSEIKCIKQLNEEFVMTNYPKQYKEIIASEKPIDLGKTP